MKLSDKIKIGYFIICLIIIYTLFNLTKGIDQEKISIDGVEYNIPESPTSILMYELIEKYSEHYNIPKHIAYNIAYMETRYLGPFHWKYNPSLESSAGAVGAMQIMPSTSHLINKKKYTKKRLRDDVRLNCITSMKLLSRLHKKYKNWAIVCGCYNTGKPMVNQYAKYCSTHLNYKEKWLDLK